MISSRQTLFPSEVLAFLGRRLYEIIGIGALSVAAFLFISLVSYHSSDPSFSAAVDGDVRNLGGLIGSYTADFLLRWLGWAGALTVPLWALWGMRLLREDPLKNIFLRLCFIPFALLFSAIVFTIALKDFSYGLSCSYGGILGTVLGSQLMEATHRLMGQCHPFWILIPLIPLAGTSIGYGCGITWQEMHFLAQILGRGAVFLWSWGCSKILSGQNRGQNYEGIHTETDSDPRFTEPSFPKKKSSLEMVPLKRAIFSSPPSAEPLRAASPLELSTAGGYHLPSLDFLRTPEKGSDILVLDEEIYTERARELEAVLAEFGVKGDITQVHPGPVVTLYELKPAAGTKSARVVGLADDIARSMSAVSARVAVIPGRNVIGIELPNPERAVVYLQSLLSNQTYERHSGFLPLALGKDIGGVPVIADLTRMPHLLVAGTTGSGKSVAINTMILSLLYRLSPEKCKFIMIDPKMLELSVYDGIPHLLSPVVTDPKKAIVALKWVVREMENRYRDMSKLGVRNIAGYNARLMEARESGEILMRKIQTGFDSESGKPVFENQSLDLEALPFIVVVVDEMADLMLVAGKEIESAVQRLAQMARAAGIHLIMATQRPSVDVITGTIKANFPTRISFQVTSKIDSRTILGEQGAEQLLGQGDMLFMAPGGRLMRVHGPYVGDEEVEKIVGFLKNQAEPNYVAGLTEDTDDEGEDEEGGSSSEEPLYEEAVALVLREGKASTSFIQRHLQIGYNRAARLIEIMEKRGVVSPANHVGKREIIGA